MVFIEASNLVFVRAINFYQWRSVTDPLFSKIIRGIEFLKEVMLSRSFL